MRQFRRWLLVLAFTVCCLGSGGCTLVKPVVGAIAGPFVILAASDGTGFGCDCDGRAIVVALAVMSAVGAVVGLVTGIISDVQALTGAASDPTANWWHPLKTNTSAVDYL
ncbi:MAG: hypothetical protein ABIP94_07265 [Planctomycetota bacterium]